MKDIRCWEYRKCGREPDGENVKELGLCPASLSPDSSCWQIAGTFCSGKVEGPHAEETDTCMICDYYNKMQESGAKRSRSRFLLFGQYLNNLGLVTNDQVIQARALQLKNNKKIGDLARSRGMLADDQIQQILILQEETLNKFGKLAIQLGFLNEAQVRELIREQDDHYLFFGEALVRLGLLTQAEMFEHLKAYNAVKIQKQLEQEKIRTQLAENS